MKRIVSLVIAVSMVFSMFATVFAAGTYTDLTGDNAKFAGAVAALSELRVDDQPVINGYPDGTFGPQKEVTRAELAKMLVVCLGLGSEVEALATKTVFSDVATNYWAAGWINAAAQSKVIVGYPDGEFKPEKTVTYAEAFTMALRALGYGNVADFEGTWPTAYMLKAVELDLTRDMDGVKADAASLRGNIAILLWNMLRTPMWRVTEESENSGMTLSNANRQRMLNVKFPDYTYVEDVYVDDVNVTDVEDVALALNDIVDDKVVAMGDAQIRGVDITRLIAGEKVTALVKEGKKGEDPTYLTLTPVKTLVEGVVTKVDGDKFTVNDTEYRMDPEKGDAPIEVAVDMYVLFEADGKKVSLFNDTTYVIKELPVGGTEVEDTKSALRKIKEDSLVIKDGEWIDREDIEEGDVYTEMKDWSGKSYWQIASVDARVTGSFESLTSKKEKDVTSYYVKVDGDDIRVLITPGNNSSKDELVAYEGEKNDKKITPLLKCLQEKPADNKYIDQEVEVVVDYLGTPIKLYFGDVDELNNGGNFYAVANGVWETSAKGGSIKNISLVGFDGEGASEDDVSEGIDHVFKKGYNTYDADHRILGQDNLFENETPVFVWANFDTDGETIKTLIPFEDGKVLTSGETEDYKSKYTIIPLTSGDEVKDGKVHVDDADYSGEYRVSSAQVMTVTPLRDEDDKVVEGYAVEITSGLENGDRIPGGSFIAVDLSKKIQRATYVFLAEKAESTEWHFGVVTNYDNKNESGKLMVEVNDESVEFDEDESEVKATEFRKDDVVAYTIYKEKIRIHEVITAKEYLDAKVQIISEDTEALGSEVEGEGAIIFKGDNAESFDLGEESDDIKNYKTWKVVEIGVDTEEDNETLTLDDCNELEEKGLLAIPNEAGIRVFFSPDENHKYILVFKGLKVDENAVDGILVDAEGDDDDDTPVAPAGNTMTSGENYTVTVVVTDEALENSGKTLTQVLQSIEPDLQSDGLTGIVLERDPFQYTPASDIELRSGSLTTTDKFKVTYSLSGTSLKISVE